MSTSPLPKPILFTYPESVFARRLRRYLALRHIPHTQITVPPNLPRPLLTRLSIQHRRIPLLAFGRSIYIDTRLIIRKLETLYSGDPAHPSLAPTDPFQESILAMLESWVIDAGPFWRAAGCLPPSAPLLQDADWMQDRSDGSGGGFTAVSQQENRAWCLSQLRVYLTVIEGFLSDGREWLLGGTEPGLAEIHAWAFEWVLNIAEDMDVPESRREEAMRDVWECLSEVEFPRTYAWVRRWRECVRKKEGENTENVEYLEGREAEDEVVRRILQGGFMDDGELEVDERDVQGLKRGQRVSVGPTDFGFTHVDVGELVGLSRDEVIIKVSLKNEADGFLRLHFPRAGFKILPLHEVKHDDLNSRL